VNAAFQQTKFDPDAGECPQGHLEGNQDQGDQDQGILNGQIQALFSFTSSQICIVLGN